MKLHGKKRLGVVNDPLIGQVIGIGKQNGPIGGQFGGIDGEAVVLRGDVTAPGSAVDARLVVATVPVSMVRTGSQHHLSVVLLIHFS